MNQGFLACLWPVPYLQPLLCFRTGNWIGFPNHVLAGWPFSICWPSMLIRTPLEQGCMIDPHFILVHLTHSRPSLHAALPGVLILNIIARYLGERTIQGLWWFCHPWPHSTACPALRVTLAEPSGVWGLAKLNTCCLKVVPFSIAVSHLPLLKFVPYHAQSSGRGKIP